jgi:cysteine desulfurase/selenocysteine lyase
MLCKEKGAVLKIIPINDDGELMIEEFEKLISRKTRLVSLVYVSNSLGTVNPVAETIAIARSHGIPVLLDAAQAVQHLKVDVQKLDCDFLTFSGHKMYAPTGIGVLYGKKELLEKMPPYQGGGEMIRYVTFDKTTYNEVPHKFEAGTPNIAGVVGLGTAIDYITKLGIENIAEVESELLAYGTEILSSISGLKIIGNAAHKSSVISFVLDQIHPHDIGTILDREGIAIRTGHHCTYPVMQRFGVPATSRASLAFYNTKQEIEKLAEGIYEAKKILS